MKSTVRHRILKSTQAHEITEIEPIQCLWNQYGLLSRVHLRDGLYPSVIMKHIQIPKNIGHPRGFTSHLSHARKIQSYQVETYWYLHYNHQLSENCPTPKCLDAFDQGDELFLLLEDLNQHNYHSDYIDVTWPDIQLVISWLANFHAIFMGKSTEGLWSCGSYWHLATRPEELSKIKGTEIHTFASFLDARLNKSSYVSVIHGDAKLANFCLKLDRTGVAAVDFQYVGQGCGMKDLAYFIGSCLTEKACEIQEEQILNYYFKCLSSALPECSHFEDIEKEWRALYTVAWADFQRFMLGWSPGHRKLTRYSERVTQQAIDQIIDDLLSLAEYACRKAGEYIQSQLGRVYEVNSKGFQTRASDVVTEVDVYAQKLILDILEPSIQRYDLGILAEEGDSDQSRLTQHAFWAIDPLDGTQYFIEGQAGYATSIALVLRNGQSILAAVYDPVEETMYRAVKGRGATANGQALETGIAPTSSSPWVWFADRSLESHMDFTIYQSYFEIVFLGGAVMNILQLLKATKSIYVKAPKPNLGGCAIWDLAAVSLILEECQGSASFFDGSFLDLNRRESIYFNDVGLVLCSADLKYAEVMDRFQRLKAES